MIQHIFEQSLQILLRQFFMPQPLNDMHSLQTWTTK